MGKLEKVYIRSIKSLIFLIPFIPLIVSHIFVFPWIEGKNYVFRISVELALVLWFALIAAKREYRPQNSLILTVLLVFTFITGLADIMGVNPNKSFWSSFERMEGYVTILHLMLYFIIIKSLFRTKKDWIIFFNIFFTASALVSFQAIYHKLLQDWPHREFSTIGSATFLASYMLLSVFVGLLLMMNIQKKYLRVLYVLAVLLQVLTIYFTATRGVIFAGFVGVIFFSLFYLIGRPATVRAKLYKKIALIIIVGCILLPVVIWSVYDITGARQETFSSEYKDTISRFYTIFSDKSFTTRINAWKVAWEGVKERPVLGWGQENFFSVYILRPVPFGETMNMERPHNIILQWLINAGILGLVAYLALFVAAFYVLWVSFRENVIVKSEAVLITTCLFAYFLQNLLIFDTINTYIIFFALLAYIDHLDPRKISYQPETSKKHKSHAAKYFAVTMSAFLLMTAVAYFVNYKPMRQSFALNRILYKFSYERDRSFLVHFDDFKNALINKRYRSFFPLLDDFENALSYNTFGNAEVRHSMVWISEGMLRHKDFEIEGVLKFIQATAVELKKMLVSDPLNLKNWVAIIDFYHDIAVYEPSYINKAEVLIKECMRLSPENQWVYFALADNYILKKDYENALKTIKRTVALDPQNDVMQVKLALAGIFNSRKDIMDSALENAKKIRMAKDSFIASGRKPVFSVDELLFFAQASGQVENYRQGLHFYEDAVSIEPEMAGLHFDMAEIYLKLGEKENAVEAAEKAAELDPKYFSSKAERLADKVKSLIE